MKIKASLRYHTAEEIYAYLTHHFGKLSLLIKKGYAIITLEKKQAYDSLLKDHKVIKLSGRPLSFKSYF